MSNENPYAPSNVSEQGTESPEGEKTVSSGQASYNAVSDLVVGVNVRKKDNAFQAIFILVTVLIFAIIGIIAVLIWGDGEIPWWGGAIAGAIPGLVVGLVLSGIYLMIYRARRHMAGKHD